MKKKETFEQLEKRITYITHVLSISKDELARYINRSRPVLHSFEKGTHEPSDDIIQKIIEAAAKQSSLLKKIGF